MRALVQRVTSASVTVIDELDERTVSGSIGAGLCAFIGVTHGDTEVVAAKIAEKIWHLRIFEDDEGVMNRSLADGCGDVLVVSQFTLYANTNRGRRPSWVEAARPEAAEPLVEAVVRKLRALGAHVETGRFRAEMQVELVNDGPVTLMIEL